MPLQTPLPLENSTTINATRHIKSTHHHEDYHAAHHKHVDTPYDKHSKLYHADLWNWHDLYNYGVSYDSAVVTRSQTAFNRIGIGEKETRLFSDKYRHHPPNLPHLIMTMKDGTYGALPRTIITRSMTTHLEENPTLCKTLEAYESFKPPPSHFDKNLALKELKEKDKPYFRESPSSNISVKQDKEEMKEDLESTSSEYFDAILPSNNKLGRFIDQPKLWTNPCATGEKPPLIRESKLTVKVLNSLSHQNMSSLSEGFSKIFKEPSFTINQNYFALTQVSSEKMENRSREEDGENKVQSPRISAGGLRQLPSPMSRDGKQNRMKSPSHPKQAPSVMFS